MKKIVKSLFSREKFTRVTLPILLIIALIIIGYFSFNHAAAKNLNETQAKARVEEFVNAFLMQGGNKATVKEITKEYGLYKVKIDIVSDTIDSYLTKDGKLFFPQALDIDKINAEKNAPANNNAATAASQTGTVSVKNDKPKIELFVMSYCPYGTQMEKGLLPVLDTLGDKVDFSIKFNSYSMHGLKELQEELTQSCLQNEQLPKYHAYLKCFLGSSNSASCLDSTGINKSKLASCVAKTDKQYKVTDNFNNKVGYQGDYPGFDIYKADNEKYNVGGSPTLIINGQEISTGRDSASLLKTICSAFNNEPKECQATLSGATPAAGFGTGTEAANGSATGAGCAN